MLDRTVTAMGSRLLRHWLHHPLRDRAALAARLDAVALLRAEGSARTAMRTRLRHVADVERISARVALKSEIGRAHV